MNNEIRLGRVCASNVHKLMGIKGIGLTGQSYMVELETEKRTGENKSIPTTYAMQWGIDHEQEAAQYYMAATKIEILQGNTIYNDNIVGTPDYLANDFGVEIKCPNSDTHMRRLMYNNVEDIKSNEPNYYWQMQAYMYLTGFDKWVFYSYDPRFKANEDKGVVFTLLKNEKDIELMLNRINEAKQWIKEQTKQ